MMKDRKIEKYIRNNPVPPYDEKTYQKTLELLGTVELHPERQRMNWWEFYTGQIHFISRKVWAVKLLLTVLLLLGIWAEGMRMDNGIWMLISVSAPLLCLANINEICNICRPGMQEILRASRHSLREMLLVRMILFGTADILICLAGAVLTSGMTSGFLWQALLYFISPFGIMCGGCLVILNRCRNENIMWYCTAWGGLLVTALTVMRNMDVPVYEAEQVIVWGAAGLLGILVTGIQMHRLFQTLGGKNHEIIYGTFI